LDFGLIENKSSLQAKIRNVTQGYGCHESNDGDCLWCSLMHRKVNCCCFFQIKNSFQISCNFSACNGCSYLARSNDLRKASISFATSVRPSVLTYQPDYNWTDFRKIGELWKSL
jgi:hypothetical protein